MKITVITPVYNGAETIRTCVESVRTQTYGDLEYIIVDGGSTDDIRRNQKPASPILFIRPASPITGLRIFSWKFNENI